MPTRSRLIAGLLLLLAVLALSHYVRAWSVIPAAQARTSDFAGSYTAATLWRQGAGVSMYDVASEERVMAAAGVPAAHLYIPFENPPLAAVVASPFSLLDAYTAYRLWSLFQLGLLVAAVGVAMRTAPWRASQPRLERLAIGAVAVAGFGTGLLFVEGQWDGIAALGLALAWAGWRSGRGFAPGFAVGFSAALAKPHLAIGVVAFMAGRRDWRGLAGAATGAAAVGAAGLLAAGPGATSAFVRAILQPANSPSAQMEGATGLFGSLLGGGLIPFGLALLAGGAAAVAAGWLGAVSRRRADLLAPCVLGAVALSLFASPHLLGHDLVLLAPPLVAALAWAPRPVAVALFGGWSALSLAALSDLGQNGVGFPGRLTPWVLLGCCAGLVLLAAVSRGARSAPRAGFARSVSLAARY